MKLTQAEAEQVVIVALRKAQGFPDWRFGQALFNTLQIQYPELANSIRGTEADCFYNDSKILTFLKAITSD